MTEVIQIPDIPQSNMKHDREHGDPFEFNLQRTRSAWNSANMVRRGLLTDRKIAKYEQMGFYSEEYRTARRKAMDAKKNGRKGNFISDGERLIYSPR